MDNKPADNQPVQQWEFKPDDTASPAPTNTPDADVPESSLPQPENLSPISTQGSSESVMTWSAAEFIAHDKSSSWYLALFGATVALAAVIYLLTKDKISAGIVLVGGLALGIFAARKPQEVQYAIDRTGLTIGQRHVTYGQFRSFSVVDEGALSS